MNEEELPKRKKKKVAEQPPPQATRGGCHGRDGCHRWPVVVHTAMVAVPPPGCSVFLRDVSISRRFGRDFCDWLVFSAIRRHIPFFHHFIII